MGNPPFPRSIKWRRKAPLVLFSLFRFFTVFLSPSIRCDSAHRPRVHSPPPHHRFSSATIRLSSFPEINFTPFSRSALTRPGFGNLHSSPHRAGLTTMSGALHRTITSTSRHTTILSRQHGLFSRCPNDGMTYQLITFNHVTGPLTSQRKDNWLIIRNLTIMRSTSECISYPQRLGARGRRVVKPL
jgi:hypothetical protein